MASSPSFDIRPGDVLVIGSQPGQAHICRFPILQSRIMCNPQPWKGARAHFLVYETRPGYFEGVYMTNCWIYGGTDRKEVERQCREHHAPRVR
jgi:hypothetical protein